MSAAAQVTPLVEARGVTVRFGKVTALDGFDLVAPPGAVLAILGPNGAGKTTFVRAVATLLRPASGELRVLGNDVAASPVADPSRLDAAGQILERVTSGAPRLDRGARRASAPAAGGASELATVISCLDGAAIGVDEIGVRRPTLDEVFLTLTGDQARTPVTAARGQDRS